MNKFFSETLKLGPNWETTIWGGLTLAMAAIVADPTLISFLPDNIEAYVLGISKFMTFVFGGAFAMRVKSANVTGGTTPATKEAEERIEK